MQNVENEFEEKVVHTFKKYGLAGKKDRIAVASSGGKDSTAVLYILKKMGLDIFAIHINLGIGEWSDKNQKNLEQFCLENDIPLRIVHSKKEFGKPITELRSVVLLRKGNLRNCAVCGVIRRWILNKKAKEFGATALATGHNLDDEAQTVLMNLFRGSPDQGLGKGPKSTGNTGFIKKIKPLYFCTEKEVETYSRLKKFPVIYQPCPCSFDASRQDTKEWMWKIEKKYPGTEKRIVEQFLSLTKKMEIKNKKTFKCSSCGEPSRSDFCMACRFLELSE